jgi:hypothetical protein
MTTPGQTGQDIEVAYKNGMCGHGYLFIGDF